ncbi:MAG: pilus assembly protein PilP [Gammaproteobacteria bacterium]|nr:pilus assembly protein PilP [Gammaproteobacteria bacterium]
MIFSHSSRNKIIALLAVSLPILSACSKDHDDLNAFISSVKSKHQGTVKPIPQFKPYKNFIYSASDLRDPFQQEATQNIDEAIGANALKPNISRPKEVLEGFPLDTLRMVGLLEQNNIKWGLIKDPTNVVHRVLPGNYAGQNEGQIVLITENSIEFLEIVADGLGGYIERKASLALGND